MELLLQRLNDLEKRLDDAVDGSLGMIPRAPTAHRVLRLFLSQKYMSSSGTEDAENVEKEKAHFILRFEGLIIDLGDVNYRCESLSKYIDAVNVTVYADRKLNVLSNFEWSSADFPKGVSADVIQIRIPAEKSYQCRVEVKLSDHAITKYSVSTALRSLLQCKTLELTKQEILDGTLAYMLAKNMFLDRDRRSFKCDDVLRDLIGIEFSKVSDIWSKLLSEQHIRAVDRLDFDLALNCSNVSATPSAVEGNGAKGLAIGTKVLDVEVRGDFTAFARSSQLRNSLAASRYDLMKDVRIRQDALRFLQREVEEDRWLLLQVEKKSTEFVNTKKRPRDEVASQDWSTESSLATFPRPPIPTELINRRREHSKKTRFQPFTTVASAIHPYSAFLDVSQDAVYHSGRRWIVASYGLQAAKIESTSGNGSGSNGADGAASSSSDGTGVCTAATNNNSTTDSNSTQQLTHGEQKQHGSITKEEK